MFFSPSETFAELARRPRWVVPVIILVVMTLVFTFALSRRVGWDRTIRETLESNENIQQMPPEQREIVIRRAAQFAGIVAYAAAIAGTPVTVALVAAVLLLMSNLLGARLTYRQLIAITSYAFLVGVLSIGLSILVLYLKSPNDFNPRNPLAFNVAAFLDPTKTPLGLWTLARSLDLFVFWRIALLALGISVASGRISFPKALAAVVIPWVILVLIGVGWAALFGGSAVVG